MFQMYERAIKCIIYYETSNKPEKFLKAYWDSMGKVWTIGIGSTRKCDGTPIKQEDTITLPQAYKLMECHINKEILPYLKDIKTEPHQLEAFISLIYNIGITQFLKSDVLKYHKAHKSPADMEVAFGNWRKSGGKVEPGLVARRKTEAHLYNTGELKY